MEKSPGSDVELLAFLFCYEWEAMGEVGAIWGDLRDKSFVDHTLQRPRVSRTSFFVIIIFHSFPLHGPVSLPASCMHSLSFDVSQCMYVSSKDSAFGLSICF